VSGVARTIGTVPGAGRAISAAPGAAEAICAVFGAGRMTAALAATAIEAAAGLVLLLAALADLRRFEIPDWLPIFLAVLSLASVAVAPGAFSAPALLSHLSSGLVVFAAGAGLFALGAMGGGDVKLLAALALATGLPGLPGLLGPILLSGGVLAFALLVARRLAPALWHAPRPLPALLTDGAPLPYAVAILSGALFWAATRPC